MRKRRTREHVIADLSRHHVERFILRSGHVIQKVESDYGYDLIMVTFDANGFQERGFVYLQLKATDRLRTVQSGQGIAFTLDMRDLRLWSEEEAPVILVVYDASNDCAYWMHIQNHFSPHTLPPGQATVTVRIPQSDIVDEAAIERFRLLKAGSRPSGGGE